jgi:hypothetical protein
LNVDLARDPLIEIQSRLLVQISSPCLRSQPHVSSFLSHYYFNIFFYIAAAYANKDKVVSKDSVVFDYLRMTENSCVNVVVGG